MSLINDALKRAKQAQSKDSNAGAPPLPPVETKSQSASPWILIAAIVLFIASILIFAISSHSKQKNIPAPIAAAPAPVSMPAELPKTNSAVPTVTNAPPVVVEPLPKIQGIIYDELHPVAIVDRKTVRVGDRVGDYKIMGIAPASVTFQLPDGSFKEIKVGEQ